MPHQSKLARNSGTRTLCSIPKRCNSNGAISMFEIRLGELRATFLRNHNMRCHNDPTKCPKPGRQLKPRRPPQPRQSPQPPQARGRCTRYVAVHPLRGGAPEQKRCIAYGSGAVPQQTRKTRNWHTKPLTATPLHAHLDPTGGRMGTPPTPPPALRPTPTPPRPLHAKSRLTCAQVGPERHLTGRRRDLWERTRPPMPQHLELPPPTCSV